MIPIQPMDCLAVYLENLNHNLIGTVTAKDPECVHRLRVSCRRLRNALKIFKSQFSKEQRKKWDRDLHVLAQSAGAARDMDVHILFLDAYIGKLKSPSDKTAVTALYRDLIRQRAALQPELVRAIKQIQRAGVLEQVRRQLPGTAPSTSGRVSVRTGKVIRKCLRKFIARSSCAAFSDKTRELHQLRIAAKHLRYTLEVFAPVFGERLEKFTAAALKVQRTLGEWHDYDLWAKDLARRKSVFKNTAVKKLRARYLSLRDRSYQEFFRFWKSAQRRKIWAQLDRTTKSL